MTLVVASKLPPAPLDALRALSEGEEEIERLRREQVIAARKAGASWEQVGEALGMTRQSAWEQFAASTRTAIGKNVDANEALTEDEALELAVTETKATRRQRR